MPSIPLGLMGAITHIASPPPSLKAIFDFGLAGPLAGMAVSLALLVQGLSLTAALDVDHQALLPVFPTYMLRGSALGGTLTELFLGKGLLTQNPSEGSVLPLHAFAISGFSGIVMNALALLPLGRTYSGAVPPMLVFNSIALLTSWMYNAPFRHGRRTTRNGHVWPNMGGQYLNVDSDTALRSRSV